MIKRVLFAMCVTFLTLLLVLPATPTTAAQTIGYQEGAYLSANVGYTIANTGAEIRAVKTVNGRNRSAEFQFSMHCGGYPYYSIAPVTLQVPIDVDYLSVSRDLGWAGLDADVDVVEQNSQATQHINIHVSWWATSGVTESNGQFQRPARIRGTITSPRCSLDFDQIIPGNAASVYGYIFSTREPKPRY